MACAVDCDGSYGYRSAVTVTVQVAVLLPSTVVTVIVAVPADSGLLLHLLLLPLFHYL